MRSYRLLLILSLVIPLVLSFTLTGEQMAEGTKRSGDLSGDREAMNRLIIDQVSDSTITEYMTRLVDFRTRLTCTDSNLVAGQWIYDKFVEFGYTEVYFDSLTVDHPRISCDIDRNIVAVKEGSVNPDNVIVIGGHYDTMTFITSECNPDTLAPGADDDASGVAATLELARVFSNMDNEITLIFAAFGSEELGTWGSRHIAEELYNEGADIRLMINLDVIAYTEDETWDTDIRVDSTAIPFADIFIEMAEMYTDLIPSITIDDNVGGDAEGFNNHGYSAIWPLEADFNFHLHECTDNMENVSIPFCTDITEMTAASMLAIMVMPDAPEGFEVVNLGDGTSLSMSWDPNGESDLAYYNVFWGTQPGVYDSSRTVTMVGDTIHNLAEGETYYLALSATDTDDNESFLSGEIRIVTNSTPQIPTGLTSASLDSEIVLDWEPNESELDLAGYYVYRHRADGVSDTTLLGFVPEPATTFSDLTAEVHTLYGYHVTAIDTESPPAESHPSEGVYGRLATHDMGILVVDNTADGSGGPLMPTDEDVDAFYSDILRNYNVQNTWDSNDSIQTGRAIMDYDMGIYSVVMWHSDVRGMMSEVSDTTEMRKYLDVGGNLWISGWKLLAFLSGGSASYYVFEENDFVNRYVGIDSARTTSATDRDFIGAESLIEDFPAIEVDSGKVFPFDGLFETEVLLPPFVGTDSLYAYVSSDSAGSEYHGLPVGMVSNSTEYGLVVTDFPLYFMDQTDAELLTAAVMALFGEPVGIGEGGIVTELPRTYSLSQNYPNPFNPMTTIRFEIPGASAEKVEVTLRIYDIRGRLIKTLIDDKKDPGSYQIAWDGRDNRESKVASGMYLYTIKVEDFSSTRKMMLLK
jgi:hypothetical protein